VFDDRTKSTSDALGFAHWEENCHRFLRGLQFLEFLGHTHGGNSAEVALHVSATQEISRSGSYRNSNGLLWTLFVSVILFGSNAI
jgi:hypothetical protein